MCCLASNASFFDAIAIDYKPLDEVVDSLIRHQFNKESLEEQKPHKAFKTKALHDGSISEISKYTEKKSCVDGKDKYVQCRYDAIIARLDRLKEELKNVEEEKVKYEGEMAISRDEKVHRDKLYCEAELKKNNTDVGVPEAQASIKEWERLYNESVDRINIETVTSFVENPLDADGGSG
ncbi:hypothetical protein Tco_1575608 [Tanacetum coccineum]